MSQWHQIVVGIAFMCVLATASVEGAGTTASNMLRDDGVVANWNVLVFTVRAQGEGPGDGSDYLPTFRKDYLGALGGEGAATISADTQVSYKDALGRDQVTTAYADRTYGSTRLPSRQFKSDSGRKVVYAFCMLESDKAQRGQFYFGSDDEAQVWVNGKLVLESYKARGCQARDDAFTAELRAGANAILVKTSQRNYSWVFEMEAYTTEGAQEALAKTARDEKLRQFQECHIRAIGGGGFVFAPGPLPKLGWEDAGKVKELVGEMPLRVRWFNRVLEEVTTAEAPGRYMAIAESTMPDGSLMRRGLTFCCLADGWEATGLGQLAEALGGSMSRKIEEGSQQPAEQKGRQLMEHLTGTQEGAAFLCYLTELVVDTVTPPPGPTDTAAMIMDQDYHLALKLKLMGREVGQDVLRMPRKIAGAPAPVLREGTAAEAGVKEDAAAKIRAVCEAWYAQSHEPFAVLVARRGVIIIHEAFGEKDGDAVTVDTPMYMASITKPLCAQLLAQFVDQGLIDLDEPVGKYLPGLPTEGDKAITFRQCYTHTSGLRGHAMYGGLTNPYLENVIANGLSYVYPGQSYEYNGTSQDLAAKAMEVIAGKSILRMEYESSLYPLGLRNTRIVEMAGGTMSTTGDIAKLGQMLLNRGAYGDTRFYSEETFEKLLPRRISDFWPNLDGRWEVGIGLYWMPTGRPSSGPASQANPDEMILSPHSFGHGAASLAVLRVDPVNELVIVQTRNTGGPMYEEYLPKFFEAIMAGLLPGSGGMDR